MAFGETVRDLRRSLGLTQEELAAREPEHLSQTYVSQVESGKIPRPRRQKMQALSRALGVPFNRLMAAAGFIELADLEEDEADPDQVMQDIMAYARQNPKQMAELRALRDENTFDVYKRAIRDIHRHMTVSIQRAREEAEEREHHHAPAE